MKQIFSLILGLGLLAGCAVKHPETPTGFIEKEIETKYLSFAVWEKVASSNQPMRIYIEGDGTPAPQRPYALEMAVKDTTPNVIYIARPCQYVSCKECRNPALWLTERYNDELVQEMRQLILYLVNKYQPSKLELVGYDGGGTMALLLAPRLPVAKVITVGGILNTHDYMEKNNLPPVAGENPADNRNRLARIPQEHYVGEKDTLATRKMAERFVARLNNPVSAVVKVVPMATHTKWEHLVIE